MQRKLYLVCYDIPEPKRQRLFRYVVKRLSVSGQYSAYECWLIQSERQKLVNFMLSKAILGEDACAILRRINILAKLAQITRSASPTRYLNLYRLACHPSTINHQGTTMRDIVIDQKGLSINLDRQLLILHHPSFSRPRVCRFHRFKASSLPVRSR